MISTEKKIKKLYVIILNILSINFTNKKSEKREKSYVEDSEMTIGFRLCIKTLI